MKIIITESQKKLLFENSAKESLIDMIKTDGFKSSSELVGGNKNLLKLLNIEGPMGYLNLFNGLNVVHSKENPDLTSFKYKSNHILMVYSQKIDRVYVNYENIWSVLENDFGLKYSETQELIKVWLGEVYNLRGVTPWNENRKPWNALGEVYNLRGVTPRRASVFFQFALGEVYNLK